MSRNVVTCSASSISGIQNFGDELLTEIYQGWVRASGPAISGYHLTVDGHGVLSREAHEWIRSASCLIFTGGGYFADGDYGSAYGLRRHARALRNRRVYWTVFKLARRYGVPCAVVGLEVGPLANPPYRRAVRHILRAARRVVVRNTESRSYVEQLCGDSVRVDVQLDAALAAASDIETGSGARERSPGDVRIAVHVHSVDGEIDGDACVDLVEHIRSHVPTDREARLFYFHDQLKQGAHPGRSVRAEGFFADAFPGITVVPYSDPISTTAAVDEMDVLVTSKLHLGIVARSLGVPVLAIGGHPKIRRFYESIDEGPSCGEPPEIVRSGLPAQVAQVLDGRAERAPIGVAFRQSAMGNKAAVEELLSSLLG